MNCLNLGCGEHFHPDWVNIDFKQTGPGVIAHNLAEGIPFENGTFDVVYHSHVLEHFTPSQGEQFIRECFRVLRPGGILRVAVPDLEQICRLYLLALEKAESGEAQWQHNYDWIMLELFDQCVRNQSGGAMLKYLVQDSLPNESFIADRLGVFYDSLISGINQIKQKKDLVETILKEQELSEAQVGKFRKTGEVHQWMYDRYSLGRLLQKVGFQEVRVWSADQSNISNWREFNLDTDKAGNTYKADSLYMEGLKP